MFKFSKHSIDVTYLLQKKYYTFNFPEFVKFESEAQISAANSYLCDYFSEWTVTLPNVKESFIFCVPLFSVTYGSIVIIHLHQYLSNLILITNSLEIQVLWVFYVVRNLTDELMLCSYYIKHVVSCFSTYVLICCAYVLEMVSWTILEAQEVFLTQSCS